MKYVSEFQDPKRVKALAAAIGRTVTRPWTVMEICGGQTHSLLRYGLLDLLPPGLELVHGPGCPVCVTDQSVLDEALVLASLPGVIFCTFGDMLRVPASRGDLAQARAAGADVRVLTSALESVQAARQNPGREVVFFGIGFETTVPTFAVALDTARRLGLVNWSLLLATVRVPPAIVALLGDPDNRLDGFLAAGHVCTVQGLGEYEPLVKKFGVPIVATGFEPVDLLTGLWWLVQQLEKGEATLQNAYARSVAPQGNPAALALVDRYFTPIDRPWRGMGVLPQSGLGVRPQHAAFDALARFAPALGQAPASAADTSGCQSGLVLTGRLRPGDCPHFFTRCTPQNPLGATMVSSEGACQAYYRYGHRKGA